MTSWLMWDSTTPEAIPGGAQAIAAYENGKYEWVPSQLSRFVGRCRLLIDVIGSQPHNAQVLQVDGTDQAQIDHMIGLARNWVQTRHNLGQQATVYVDRSNLPAVQRELEGLAWHLWLATGDGTLYEATHEIPGAIATVPMADLVAVQAWFAPAVGLHADLSVIVSESWYTGHGGQL